MTDPNRKGNDSTGSNASGRERGEEMSLSPDEEAVLERMWDEIAQEAAAKRQNDTAASPD